MPTTEESCRDAAEIGDAAEYQPAVSHCTIRRARSSRQRLKHHLRHRRVSGRDPQALCTADARALTQTHTRTLTETDTRARDALHGAAVAKARDAPQH